MSKPTVIAAIDAAENFGVVNHHERMPNGEFRFRLTHVSGNGYILTISGEVGSWQKSHYHESISEVYIVEAGWMALAELKEGCSDPRIKLFFPGSVVQTAPRVAHNVFLPSHARIHTVKIGARSSGDWIAAPELDTLLRQVTEDELLSRFSPQT